MTREASFAKSSMAALGVGAAAAGVAIAGLVVAVGKQATQAAETLERDSLRLDAVLRATGESAGLTAGQIKNFADELASRTLADAPGIRAAATQLLTFRSIAGETFTRTLELAQDLSAVGFGGLEAKISSRRLASTSRTLRLYLACSMRMLGIGAMRGIRATWLCRARSAMDHRHVIAASEKFREVDDETLTRMLAERRAQLPPMIEVNPRRPALDLPRDDAADDSDGRG